MSAPQLSKLVEDIQGYLTAAPVQVRGDTVELSGHRPITFNTAGNREDGAALLLSFLLKKFPMRFFFDVGASAGFFSRTAASLLDPPPQVHAFEMQGRRIPLIQELIEKDGLGGRITVHHTGLTDHHKGETDLWRVRSYLYEHEPQPRDYQEPWWRRLKFRLKGRYRGPSTERLTLTSIDHFAESTGIRPNLMKIDVDGYESKVLKGSLKTLREFRPWIMLELHKDKLIRDDNRQGVMKLLLDVGYEALFLTDHHAPKACRLVHIGNPDHPLIQRQETDFVLFPGLPA